MTNPTFTTRQAMNEDKSKMHRDKATKVNLLGAKP